MLKGSTLVELAQKVQAIQESVRDFLVPSPRIRMELAPDASQPAQQSLPGTPDRAPRMPIITMEGSNGHSRLAIADHAHSQIAEATGIPLAYYRRMATDAPDLMAANVNRWFADDQSRRMVRTIRPDGIGSIPTMRALLSDRYRPLDNYQLLESVLPILHVHGISVESCEVTEKKLYLKAVNKRQTLDVKVGEAVQAGIMISNSEIGFGSLAIQPLVYTLRCTNGMVMQDASLKRNHVGRRHGEGDEFNHLLSNETREADDKAFFLKVRDITKASLDEAVFAKTVDKLKAAAGLQITKPDLQEVLEITAKRYAIGDEESKGILHHLAAGGDLTQWGLCSAVTRFAQDVQSYDRSTELERIGGKIVEMSRPEWQTLAMTN